jgi:PAS domain S-box-containing protein
LRLPLRVLIVEDLPEQAEIVAHELINAGFVLACSIASDPAGCRSVIEDGVDVVVADRDTVEIDLPALMALVGERSDSPPVVSLSTDGSEEIARECLQQGATAFLHKFRLDEIGELVRGLLETRSPPGAATSRSGLVGPRGFAGDARDLIAEISSDGRLLYVNPSVETSLGFTAAELTGRRVFEFVHPDDLPATLEFLQKARETGSAGRVIHRVRHRDGTWRWLESIASPHCTADGERRVVSIARDIAEPFPGVPPEVPRETTAEPAIPSADEAAAEPSEVAREEAEPETILLVEDQERLRSVIRETLAEEGYLVVEAASGEEALQRAAQHPGPIHLILIEGAMPGMGGRELATRVGTSWPRTRVILMSDSPGDDVEPLPRGVRPGCLLRKPFTLASLRAKLREILEEDPDRLESG